MGKGDYQKTYRKNKHI